MVKRSGARIGDSVYVTGTIGDSGGGLAIFKREKHALSDADRDYLTTRYRLPQPPVTLIPTAARHRPCQRGCVGRLDRRSGSYRLGFRGAHCGGRRARAAVGALARLVGRAAPCVRAVTAGDDYQNGLYRAAGAARAVHPHRPGRSRRGRRLHCSTAWKSAFPKPAISIFERGNLRIVTGLSSSYPLVRGGTRLARGAGDDRKCREWRRGVVPGAKQTLSCPADTVPAGAGRPCGGRIQHRTGRRGANANARIR